MKFDVRRVKIVVTVPVNNIDSVRDSMCGAGAGVIGDYTYCSTCGLCIGTFVPNINANPYIGTNGVMERVEEYRLEVVCEVDKVKSVVAELRKSHPYEEPAIDIIPLIDESDFV